MLRLTRPPEPVCLTERGASWTARWVGADATKAWRWPEYEGRSVRDLLLVPLRSMTDEHCAYCDGFPFDMSLESIEHFRPKATFRELAFDWGNLFLACDHCNSAKTRSESGGFEDALLKPDLPDYSFHRYFIVDFATGEVLVNPAAAPPDQARARHSIDALGWNDISRTRHRRRMFATPAAAMNERPFRFMFDDGL